MSTQNNENETFDEDEVLFEDDVEQLQKKLLELSMAGEIKHTKTFLNNKKRCTEKVMKKILRDYAEKRQRIAKMEMSIALVSVLLNLIEISGIISFKDGAQKFSAEILRDENTMFCISDLMPVCSVGDYYLKYFSAAIFVTSLCYGHVVFGGQTEETKKETPRSANEGSE